jgi:hypothetical protein
MVCLSVGVGHPGETERATPEGPPASELRYRWIYQLGAETPLASVPRQSPPEATVALP